MVSLVILVWILFVFGVGFYVLLILLASLVLDFLWDLAVFGFGFIGFGLFYVCGSFGFFAFCLVLVASLVRDLVWELLLIGFFGLQYIHDTYMHTYLHTCLHVYMQTNMYHVFPGQT